MAKHKLEAICIRLPRTSASRSLFKSLCDLLEIVPGSSIDGDSLTLSPTIPLGALPGTRFQLSNISHPSIVLDTDVELGAGIGGVYFGSNPIAGQASVDADVAESSRSDESALSVPELRDRLQGHVLNVDHTGLNIPSAITSRGVWGSLIGDLAAITTLYRYPTGEEWPFILPATDEEFESDIYHFDAERKPKFELVYDHYAIAPVLQIAVNTDLTREEAEHLLPDPYGVAIPGLADIFRTVYVSHPWHGMSMRFDLYYRGDINDWGTGEWLVRQGGRIR